MQRMSENTDQLLYAARAGDVDALGALLRAHRNGVYRYGLSVCRTTEDAEDALQETLWAATRALHSFRGSASTVVSWMFTIIRRECFRLIERRRRDPMALELDRPCCEPSSEADVAIDVLVRERRVELLARALEALDPIHRQVVLLRDIEELSAPEAAAQLGISVQALKSRLHRARARLRDHVLLESASF